MDASKFLPLIGIAIFIIVLLNVNLAEITGHLAGADPLFLAMVVLLHAPVILMKAGKWMVITRAFGKGAPLLQCVHAWLVGFVIGIATPGRIGDISKACYLKERMPLGRGIATVVIDRLIDVFALFFLAILGTLVFVYAYSEFLQSGFLYILLVFFSAFIISAFIVLTKRDAVKRLARPVFRRFVPGRYKSGMRITFHDFYLGLRDIRKRGRLVACSVVISLLSWLVIILQVKLVSMALSLEIDYLFLLSVMPVVTLLDILPISLSGLGTREVALIFFLGILSVPMATAVSFSVLIFLVDYLVLVPFGLLFWAIKPIRIEF
jgi:uncharacterized protein (TIRG00374 family)